jgi:hypothetical protein
MKSLKLEGLCVLSLLAVACGRSAPDSQSPHSAEPPPQSQSAFPSEAPSSYEGEPGEAQSAPAPTPAARAAADEAGSGRAEKSASSPAGAPAPKAEARRSAEPFDVEQERPGLGTTWGETRSSHVSSSPFERANPNSPFALMTVNYNDRTGVNAMLRGASLADFQREGVPTARGMVTVRVVDENGLSLPTLNASGRSLVIGEHGDRYAIEIQNNSGNRFEAVVTVDGLDVIDGKPGNFSKRGYLVQPFATVAIDGFRQSMDEVAAFRFGSVRNSYAGKKGDDRNVGVIGVAVFEERGATFPWTEREINRRNRANPFPGGFAEPPPAR